MLSDMSYIEGLVAMLNFSGNEVLWLFRFLYGQYQHSQVILQMAT
jgi:hypothetical protein